MLQGVEQCDDGNMVQTDACLNSCKTDQMLVWALPPGLDLDAAESETTTWHYPPTAKFERLLRETRVPMGLLANGERLLERFQDQVLEFLFARNALLAKREAAAQARAKT